MTVSSTWCNRLGFGLASLFAPVLLSSAISSVEAQVVYVQSNLASDVPGLAAHTDPSLKNPWGMSFAPTSPFWISNQVTGNTTLYRPDGTPVPLVVTIPGTNGGPQGPTGQVFNSTAADFALPVGGKSLFIFSSLNGSISGWNGGSGTTAQTVVPGGGGVYTGLALANNGSGNFLYAANAALNRIDVFNNTFSPTTLSGNFTDPNLPAGFSVYNVQNVHGTLYVTYAGPNPTVDIGGVVDAYDTNGNFLRRISANGVGGNLSDPWGLTLAPANFGPFSNDLLVGNKGDGHISAFDPLTGAFEGQLLGLNGTPIANTGLWALNFRPSLPGTDPNTLFFSAGINGERDGLFGSLRAVPEPGSLALLSGLVVSGSLFTVGRLRRRRK